MDAIPMGGKVTRAATGGMVVAPGCYVIASYTPGGGSGTQPNSASMAFSATPVNRYFGPGQTVSGSFAATIGTGYSLATTPNFNVSVTYTFSSGFEIQP